MNIKKRLVKNFLIQKILAFIAAIYIHVVAVTSNIKFINNSIPEQYWKNDRPFILAFWHSQLMMISFSWKNKKKLNIIASGHSDGRFGAYIGKYFKLNNIPTYDKHKNISLRPIFKLLQQKDYIGIAPDGPRGPKEKMSEGIIKIAKKTKIPIIPIGFWSSKNFQLKSWDSFLISKPFSRCSFVWGEAMVIPEDSTDQEIRNFQKILEDSINECIKAAKQNC
jgi:lysophospholipid acyltransferase (LPLAT)-like uncharacterized protein